jgi:hypothetical protein
MNLDELSDDWTVWTETERQVIIVYRPDIFDSEQFPAPCLPTIYTTQGKRTRRPGSDRRGSEWHVTLYLEPEIEGESESYPDRSSAIGGAVELAHRFGGGEIAYRALYQLPREAYLAELDEQTGRA